MYDIVAGKEETLYRTLLNYPFIEVMIKATRIADMNYIETKEYELNKANENR